VRQEQNLQCEDSKVGREPLEPRQYQRGWKLKKLVLNSRSCSYSLDSVSFLRFFISITCGALASSVIGGIFALGGGICLAGIRQLSLLTRS